jgi:O-antigen/teichoic acid export membrane protein
MALILVLRALAGAPAALIERELRFDRRAKGELAGTITQALVSVVLALAGAGVWSLVAGQLASQAAQLIALWVLAPFRPSPTDARWATLRELGKFGRHVTASNILGLVTDNADNAVIGRLLGATSVGLYNLAWRLANLPAIEIAFIVSRVTFPVYSTVREDLAAFRTVFRATVRRVAFLAVPVSIGILVAAKPIVIAVFGERWSGAIAPLQILAVFGIVRTVSGVTGSVFQAAHRPQLNYQIGVWHAVVLFAMLYALAPTYGVKGVAWAEVVAAVSSLIPSYFFTLRMLQLPLRDLAADLLKPAVATLAVAVSLLLVRTQITSLPPVALLLVLVAIGVAVYGVSLATIGRSELRTVVGAFRPPRPADS